MSLLVPIVADAVAVGLAVSAVAWLVGVPHDAAPPLAAAAVAAAGVLAEAFTPARRQPDGSSIPSLASAALTVLLVIPALACMSTMDTAGIVIGLTWIGLLTGGCTICLAKSIEKMPHCESAV
jgi:hypothetical protein